MSNKVKFKILFTFLNSIYRFSSEQHRNAEPLASESEKKSIFELFAQRESWTATKTGDKFKKENLTLARMFG